MEFDLMIIRVTLWFLRKEKEWSKKEKEKEMNIFG